jgi:hypothetical protein
MIADGSFAISAFNSNGRSTQRSLTGLGTVLYFPNYRSLAG